MTAQHVNAMRAPTGAMALETYELTKRFGAFTALDRVTMKVAPGTVHALLGENGAGKSTLVKCIAGFHRAEAGAILTDAREQDIANPVVARSLGIGMVYQHFTLAPGMTVAENLLLAGGRATMSGVIVGVLIMGIAENVMNLLNIPAFYQYIVRGVILLLAVLLDNLRSSALGRR